MLQHGSMLRSLGYPSSPNSISVSDSAGLRTVDMGMGMSYGRCSAHVFGTPSVHGLV